MTSSLAAEVSLHCIICFEEFDVKERPPVVLPCGHTYVCLVCAKRLRRCMECREPLFWTPSSSSSSCTNHTHNQQQPLNTRSPAPSRYAVRHSQRYSPGNGGSGAAAGGGPVQPIKEEPIALPLPKNTVLMAMMEAAERQANLIEESRVLQRIQSMSLSPSSSKQPDDNDKDNDNDNGNHDADTKTTKEDLSSPTGSSNFLMDPLTTSLNTLVGSCGTYAVREPLGLAVLPFDPNKRHHRKEDLTEDQTTEAITHTNSLVDECESIESSCASCHKKNSASNASSDTELEETIRESETQEPFSIEEGRTVQVVGVDEGVYQLARGAGYIVASANQLVKVGAPKEKSCQYEGMLKSIIEKKNDLEKELQEINYLADGLQQKITIEQEKEPDHPVISAPKQIEDPLFNDENDIAANNSPGTPTGPSTPTHQGPMHPESSPVGIRLTGSASSTEVNLGTGGRPVTPGQLHQQQQQQHNHQTPSPRQLYHNSPSRSCPMPGRTHDTPGLLHPTIDDYPAGLPSYRVATDDDVNGLPWSFGCGSTLFGERLIEPDPDRGGVMALSYDETMVGRALAGPDGTHRMLAAGGIASHADFSGGVGEHSLRSGSFDGPINFRTGMSGHTGLNVSRKKNSPMARPQIRMMSEHRGIAASSRIAPNSNNSNNLSAINQAHYHQFPLPEHPQHRRGIPSSLSHNTTE